MSNTAEEWDDMSEARQNEIRANVRARLMAACDTNASAVRDDLRSRLERASAVHYPQR